MRSRNDDGATAVEYALLAALIAAVATGAILALGVATLGLFDAVSWP
jgi:Flp pilus assembly pilin Flp